jgi:hypothetical protein
MKTTALLGSINDYKGLGHLVKIKYYGISSALIIQQKDNLNN